MMIETGRQRDTEWGGREGERMEGGREEKRKLELPVSFPFTQSVVLGKIQPHYPVLYSLSIEDA